MIMLENLRKHNQLILLTILLLSSISVILNFVSAPQARTFFYLSSYVSILSLIVNWKKTPTPLLISIVAMLALVGLSKYIWFIAEYLGNPDYNQYNPYYNTGKRLLLGAVIAWSAFSLKDYLTEKHKQAVRFALFAAFALASIIGCYQIAMHPGQRTDFFLGYATDSAYMYSAVALLTIIFLDQHKSLMAKLLMAACFIVAFYILFKTGTRNVLLFFPLVLIASLIAWKKNYLRTLSIVVIAIIIAFAAAYKPIIEPKIKITESEIDRYSQHDGNQSGSLTARFAMWEVGYHAFMAHPWGMSFEQREKFAKDYTQETKSNKSALRYIDVHLHNEVIDTATLQGIPGVVIMILAYLILLNYAFRTRSAKFLGLTFIIITVGFTDVIFISREQSIFFAQLFVLTALLSPPPRQA